jgi:hypothetical protein
MHIADAWSLIVIHPKCFVRYACLMCGLCRYVLITVGRDNACHFIRPGDVIECYFSSPHLGIRVAYLGHERSTSGPIEVSQPKKLRSISCSRSLRTLRTCTPIYAQNPLTTPQRLFLASLSLGSKLEARTKRSRDRRNYNMHPQVASSSIQRGRVKGPCDACKHRDAR